MDRLPNRFLEIVRTVVLSLFGLALVSVFVIDSVDMVLHPRATVGQFLVIISTVGGMALWTVIVGREAPTTDEKPFRMRHLGGIEVHIYSDGTRVTFEEARLISIEFPDHGSD